MDMMTVTKAAGALCGALLVFMLGQFAAEKIYAMKSHDGDHHGPAYVIDLGDEGDTDAEEETGPVFAELYAVADVGSGERVFGKCRACHAVEQGNNGTGPYLYGVVNRAVAASEGFSYSGALAAVVDTWTPEELDAFLEAPRQYAPGTTMGFNGLPKPEDRANVIAYLDMLDGDMTEVEMPAAEDSAEPEEDASLQQGATDTELAATDGSESD